MIFGPSDLIFDRGLDLTHPISGVNLRIIL
jgi:hypothetical protein